MRACGEPRASSPTFQQENVVLVWYGMVSLNVRCTFVDKCAALRAPPQRALVSAPASVGAKRGAPVIAARHRARQRSKPALHMPASAASCRHSNCRHRRCEAATAVTVAVVPAIAVSTADIRACSLSVVTSLYPVTTSLNDPHSATRSLASALCCGVTVTGLRAHGTLLCESEAVVNETTVTTGIDRVTIHELLLAHRRPVANGDEPGTFEGTRGRKSPPHIQLLWSCCIEKRILCVGGVIVAQPVDLDFDGNDHAHAVSLFSRPTNSIP